jgi:hypothetical protein
LNRCPCRPGSQRPIHASSQPVIFVTAAKRVEAPAVGRPVKAAKAILLGGVIGAALIVVLAVAGKARRPYALKWRCILTPKRGLSPNTGVWAIV